MSSTLWRFIVGILSIVISASASSDDNASERTCLILFGDWSLMLSNALAAFR